MAWGLKTVMYAICLGEKLDYFRYKKDEWRRKILVVTGISTGFPSPSTSFDFDSIQHLYGNGSE